MLRPSPAVNGKEEDMYLGKFRRKELGRDANPKCAAEGFSPLFCSKAFCTGGSKFAQKDSFCVFTEVTNWDGKFPPVSVNR